MTAGDKVWYMGTIWTVLSIEGEDVQIGRSPIAFGRCARIRDVKKKDLRMAFK